MNDKPSMDQIVNNVFRETLDSLRQDGQIALTKLQSSSPGSQKQAARDLLDVAEDIEKLVRTWINVMCRNVGKED